MTLAPSADRMQPLIGVRILDAATWVAGPWAAQVLSWLGAAVLKIDPPGGDPLRELDDGPASIGRCLDDDANRGKDRLPSRSDADYAEQILAELNDTDVLFCDWTPSRAATLGLTVAALRRSWPDLVIVSVTPYGASGPGAEWPGSELVTYHAGGEGSVLPSENVARLFPDRPPVRAGMFLADHDTGLTAALVGLAGLLKRQRGGGGSYADVSGVEVELGLNRTTVCRSLAESVDFPRGYRGYDYAGSLVCSDGWVAIRPVENNQWASFCAAIGDPTLATDERFADRQGRFDNADALTAILQSWTSVRTREAVRAVLLLAGCPGGPILSPGETSSDPAITSRALYADVAGQPGVVAGKAPVRGFHIRPVPADSSLPPASSLPPVAAAELPLAGLRVVDLTWVAAGPYATELLGFLGAEVIRIESSTRPDIFRRNQVGNPDLDASVRWMDLNQQKHSVELDIKSTTDHAALMGLIEGAHVLAENYRPGVRDRLGLSNEAVHARNPALVVLALSGFGTAATDADRPGYASIFNAESGLAWMTGYADGPPSDVRDTNDLRGGTLGALATVSALLAVSAGHGGAALDVATRDALLVLQGHLTLAASRGGNPMRSGNQLACAVPYDCFSSADGRWVALAVRTDAEWQAFTAATGVPGPPLRRDRVADRVRVDAATAAWLGGVSATDAIELLRRAGVPAGLSAVGSDLAADEQLRARRAIREVEHPRLGTLRLVQAPFVLDGTRKPAKRPPLLGEHNDLFLRPQESVPG